MNTVAKIMTGRHYIRALRCHKSGKIFRGSIGKLFRGSIGKKVKTSPNSEIFPEDKVSTSLTEVS